MKFFFYNKTQRADLTFNSMYTVTLEVIAKPDDYLVFFPKKR